MKVSERFHLGEEFGHLAHELDGLSDRAIAIVAAATVDDCLAGALKARLIDEPSVFANQLAGNGALSTFSAKIDFGRLVGLYTPGALSDLHKVRKVRNDAAHSAGLFSLSDAPMADRIRALVLPEHHILEVGQPSIDGVAMMAVYGRDEVLATPRLRYIALTLFMAWQLELGAKYGRYERLLEPGSTS